MAKRTAAPSPSTPAEYVVVARRYRPQQFADLVGQEAIARTLTNAIESNRVAHAYLFTGTRGVGKTTTARILAKALNCVRGPTPTPCDQCESCLAIAEGQDADVLEIDGASNRGIDEIRELRSTVQFRPTRGRYRIYIIDEVHMLTREAFNALLKTLEEPPEHVKFIFATTEAQKVPATILSRCQRFDFLGIAPDRIVERLRAVAQGENRRVTDDALNLIARRAAGSMRDAQSLLDQALAFAPDQIEAEHIHQMLGTAPDDLLYELVSAIRQRDVRAALRLLDAGQERGLQPGELLDQLIGYWRDLMLLKSAGVEAVADRVSAADRERLATHAEGVSLDEILCGLDLLQSARARLRNNPHARVLLEMTILRLGSLADWVQVSTLAQALATGESLPQVTAPKAVANSVVQAEDGTSKKKPLNVDDAAIDPAVVALTPETASIVWPKVLDQIGQLFAKELAPAGLPAILGPKSLVLRFPATYNRMREACSTAARVDRLAAVLRRVTGCNWDIRFETHAESNGRPQAAAPPPEPGPASEKPALLEVISSVLAAKLLQVDDGFGLTSPNDDELAISPEDA